MKLKFISGIKMTVKGIQLIPGEIYDFVTEEGERLINTFTDKFEAAEEVVEKAEKVIKKVVAEAPKASTRPKRNTTKAKPKED